MRKPGKPAGRPACSQDWLPPNQANPLRRRTFAFIPESTVSRNRSGDLFYAARVQYPGTGLETFYEASSVGGSSLLVRITTFVFVALTSARTISPGLMSPEEYRRAENRTRC